MLDKITITTGSDGDGHITFDVEWPDSLGYVETLGLLEAAKAVVHRAYEDEL